MGKNTQLFIAFFILIISILLAVALYTFFKVELNLDSKNAPKIEYIYYKNLNPINIKEIVEKNNTNNKYEKIVVEERELVYTTLYKENNQLPSGNYRVIQIGRNGKQNVVVKQTYENNELINEQIVSNNVLTSSAEKIIEIGTGSGYMKTKINKGDKVFVCANNLELKNEKNLDAKGIELLAVNEKIEIVDYDSTWCKVNTSKNTGYVLTEGISTFDPNYKIDKAVDTEELSKQQLLARLDFNMDVSVQSDLSLRQFEAVFANQPGDVNNVFKDNAKYFYYAEELYNINGLFLASIAIHESAWGTSTIAQNKKNLFGYCAYDYDPYNSASNFGKYSDGIDLVARALMGNYLNPAGTVLSDGSVASGRFHSGKTISSVNKCYATDVNWANGVFGWMKKLYDAIPE